MNRRPQPPPNSPFAKPPPGQPPIPEWDWKGLGPHRQLASSRMTEHPPRRPNLDLSAEATAKLAEMMACIETERDRYRTALLKIQAILRDWRGWLGEADDLAEVTEEALNDRPEP